MNKSEFITHVSQNNNCSKIEAERNIDIFVSSAISALAEGHEVSLSGFGRFSVSKVEARAGRNPKTGAAIQIQAYNQPKFKVGQKLKDACNS
jgi:DNA-binding protein HU-beta